MRHFPSTTLPGKEDFVLRRAAAAQPGLFDYQESGLEKADPETLKEIGRTQADSFYQGQIADQIDACSRKYGGYLRKADLEAFENEWVTPIRLNYRGYEICEIPPNGQGIVALMALNILKEFQFQEKLHVETVHRQLEAMKMAFKDGLFYITDPKAMKVKTEHLLDPQLGRLRADQITDTAQDPQVSELPQSGTVYLCTADEEGNMVSYIQSNCLLYTSPSPRDRQKSRMPSSA